MDKEFEAANRRWWPVEKQWHFPIMAKYGFKPLTKKQQGFVRSYVYVNADGIKIRCNTGLSRDYWTCSIPIATGLWAELEPFLQKVCKVTGEPGTVVS